MPMFREEIPTSMVLYLPKVTSDYNRVARSSHRAQGKTCRTRAHPVFPAGHGVFPPFCPDTGSGGGGRPAACALPGSVSVREWV